MKLSKTQQKVVDLMKKGWRLTSLMGLNPSASIYSVESETYSSLIVSIATICALLDKGVVKSTEQFPVKKYELTEKGKN